MNWNTLLYCFICYIFVFFSINLYFQWLLNYLFTNTFKGYVDEDGASDTGASLDGGTQQVDSNDEASDSDLSDVDPLDSDIEGVSMDFNQLCIIYIYYVHWYIWVWKSLYKISCPVNLIVIDSNPLLWFPAKV